MNSAADSVKLGPSEIRAVSVRHTNSPMAERFLKIKIRHISSTDYNKHSWNKERCSYLNSAL